MSRVQTYSFETADSWRRESVRAEKCVPRKCAWLARSEIEHSLRNRTTSLEKIARKIRKSAKIYLLEATQTGEILLRKLPALVLLTTSRRTANGLNESDEMTIPLSLLRRYLPDGNNIELINFRQIATFRDFSSKISYEPGEIGSFLNRKKSFFELCSKSLVNFNV